MSMKPEKPQAKTNAETLIDVKPPFRKRRLKIELHVDVPDDGTYYRNNFNKEAVRLASDLTHRWKNCESVYLTTEDITDERK